MQPILSGRSARKFQLCSSASALVMTAALVSASPAVAGVFTTGDVLGNPSLNDPFLVVGANASGLVAINGGSIVMTAGGARVGGNSATGNGSVSVLDPGSEWRVGGNNGSSLEVGINGGTGFVGIGNGAKVVTSATPTGDAFVYGKFVQIGNSGNGSMAITSGGSLVIEDSLDSGGGETLNIGGGYVGPGTGSLSVTGASSLVRVEGNGAGVSIGYGAGATGTAQFTAGAVLQLDGGANGATIHVGQNGGFGGLIVNNATIATTSQNYNVISIGENNGSGTVSVLAGGVVSLQNTGLGQSANINVGTSYAPSGSAQFTVDGGQVNLSGDGYASLYVGTDAPNLAIATITGASSNVNLTGRGANITAGRDGKSGSLQVINGATVNATASEYSAFLGIGSQGGSGAAQISSGAVVHLTGTGTANADVNVGDRYTGGGTGSLALLSGGQLVLNTAKTASVTIGTDVGSADMRIDGAGSALDMTGKRTHVNVGSYNPSPNPGGNVSGELFMGSGGSLTMNAGTDGSGLDIGAGSLGGAGRMQVFHMAQVQIDSAAQSNINVGANGGQGALTIFDSSMTAAAVKSSSLTIGRHNGSGSVTMLLAGQLNLSNTDSAFASGIDVGTSYSPSGNAELNVGSGSDVNVTSAGSSFFNVGSTPPNLAIATIAGAGSSVTLNGPGTHATVGGNGTNGRMTLSDGAAFTANASAGNAFFGVGLQNGTGAVSIVNGAAMALNSTGAGNSDFNVGGRFSGAGAGSVYVGSGGVLSLSSAANSFVNVSSDGAAARAVLNIDGPLSRVTAAGQNASVHVGTLHSGSTIGGSVYGMLTISNGAALDIAGQANGARLSIGAGTLGGYGSVNLINGGSIKMDSAGHSSIGVG
ncbi:MAG: hypothetical protein SFV21_17190, partial [Rhodospirillaceae bacterium]|nr:hypothetical protein [Rhodospirillaceae bacterium]